MPNKKGWLAILFILLCLAIPFGITYYTSTDTFKSRFAQWRRQMPAAPENASIEKARTVKDQVILVKGERIPVYNTSLVYKGEDEGLIRLDLYLEELDPDHPYIQTFSKEIGDGRVIRLGDVTYAITSVSQKTLVLKILQKLGTR